MIVIIYLCKVITCSAILFSYYYFILRNKRFHQYNRYYLLTCAAFSCLFPLVQIPLFHYNSSHANALVKTLSVINAAGWEDEIVLIAHRNSAFSFLTLQNTALALYMAGFIICSFHISRSLLYIRKLSDMYKKEKLHGVTLYNTQEPGTPFSFFRSLFWNEKIILSSEKGQQILRHELFHIRALHSYDIIFMECLNSLFWFNPFFHLFTKEIKAIHEFLADEYACSSSNKYDYAELLVTEAITNKSSLSNQFFHHQIKRRIAMLIQHHPSNFSYLRRIMALPLLFMLFCAFGFKSSRYTSISDHFYSRTSSPITVVIDAAHGGNDPGAYGLNGLSEKDLTLSIAQKIKELSGNYGINIILTRNEDILPGNAATGKESQATRINILQNSKADLFVSIHVNSTGDTIYKPGMINGFEIYVSDQNQQYERSKLLGSAISGEIKNTYKISDALKQRKSIYVLDKSASPAVLIECGYINSKTDVDFITNKQNQEKIAHDILKGIVKYQRDISVASNTNGQQKRGNDTVPASEFSRSMQAHTAQNQTDDLYVKADSATDLMLVKFKQGDSIVTRLSEVTHYFHTAYTGDQSAGKRNQPVKQENEAAFPGGSMAWMRFLNKNFHYPMEAQKNEIQGTVIVQFMVDEAGKVSKEEVVSGPTIGGLREEAVRLVKNSGLWIPLVQNGQPVASLKKQPFIFRLDRE